jgi:hypothetical protein
MEANVGHEDVLMFIKSVRVIESVLPPDARDAAIGNLEKHGEYTFIPGPGYAVHGGFVGSSVFDAGRMGGSAIMDQELPEDEVEATRTVFRVAHAKGRTVHVVDVGRESSIRRYISEHVHHMTRFPVLMRPDGRRLDGSDNCTPENLAKFLAD